jgi:hypothetical protein
MRSKFIKTPRRNFPRPSIEALYSFEDVALIADVPPIVVLQAAASGELKTIRLDKVDLVEGDALCDWVRLLDERVLSARNE